MQENFGLIFHSLSLKKKWPIPILICNEFKILIKVTDLFVPPSDLAYGVWARKLPIRSSGDLISGSYQYCYWSQGHKGRVTTLGKSRGPPQSPAETPQNPPQRAQDPVLSRLRARLKISSENYIFERATHRGPIFCEEFETSRLKFSSEIEVSIEIENFERDWIFWIVGLSGSDGPRPVVPEISEESASSVPHKIR